MGRVIGDVGIFLCSISVLLIEALLYHEEDQVLRLRLNWIVHSIFGLFNMCFLFLTPVKCVLLRIHSSVTATLFSVSAKHKFK